MKTAFLFLFAQKGGGPRTEPLFLQQGENRMATCKLIQLRSSPDMQQMQQRIDEVLAKGYTVKTMPYRPDGMLLVYFEKE